MTSYWSYSIALGHQNKQQLRAILSLCSSRFGQGGLFGDRWDYSASKQPVPGGWYENRVILFFRHEEDLVLFKLAYTAE